MTTGIIHRVPDIPSLARLLARIGMASMSFPNTPKPPGSSDGPEQRYRMPLDMARQRAALLAAHPGLTLADGARLADVENSIAALDHADELLITPDVVHRLLAAITVEIEDLWRLYGDEIAPQP